MKKTGLVVALLAVTLLATIFPRVRPSGATTDCAGCSSATSAGTNLDYVALDGGLPAGELCVGSTTTPASAATPLPNLFHSNSTMGIFPGGAFAIAVTSDGVIGHSNIVYTCGDNGNGQLGVGTTTDSGTPLQVTISNVIDAVGGGRFALVRKSDNSVWSWGANDSGQLGDNSTNQRELPVQVVTSPRPPIQYLSASHVDAGYASSYALRTDGTVVAWGLNLSGQLGTGDNSNRRYPAQVIGLSNVVAISAGFDHCMAIEANGTLWAWGQLADGLTGNGGPGGSFNHPIQVSISGVTKVAAGYTTALALKSDGTLWAWGYNANGEAGVGTTSELDSPTRVGLSNVVDIYAGKEYSLARDSSGNVWAWGNNDFGELADGTYTSSSTPHLVASSVIGVGASPNSWTTFFVR